MWRAILICLILLPGSPAEPGAWPRETGHAFVSITQDFAAGVAGFQPAYSSLYGEYGLTGDLTLGAKYGRSADRRSEAILFLRRALWNDGGPNVFAAELGVGSRWSDRSRPEPIFRPGVSWGRGFETRFGPGWSAVDATFSRASVSKDTWTNIDATVGLSPSESSHLIFQIRGYSDRWGRQVTLAPSYVRRIGGSVRAELGLLRPTRGNAATGLFAGTWIEF